MSWGRIPLFELDDLTPNGYVITSIYLDTETDELVIEYYVPE